MILVYIAVGNLIFATGYIVGKICAYHETNHK